MRLLVLGGPRFLGRAVAEASLARDHELTFFNRGQTNPELYPEVEKLRGDRAGDLYVLAGREWDAVVDTSGFLPDLVRSSAVALAGSGRYCFVSTISIYGDFSKPVDEDSPLAPVGDLPSDEVTTESYGPLKALCEEAVIETFGERALVVRPGRHSAFQARRRRPRRGSRRAFSLKMLAGARGRCAPVGATLC